ncbi:dynein heavy chain and region D6 of dynein motor-domain-containing protein [Entophlyctis helioformis]|nr:dynein heavy chain and region D6 of dynein motor-domain-containing protein [Entophlyctis helioformis]
MSSAETPGDPPQDGAIGVDEPKAAADGRVNAGDAGAVPTAAAGGDSAVAVPSVPDAAPAANVDGTGQDSQSSEDAAVDGEGFDAGQGVPGDDVGNNNNSNVDNMDDMDDEGGLESNGSSHGQDGPEGSDGKGQPGMASERASNNNVDGTDASKSADSRATSLASMAANPPPPPVDVDSLARRLKSVVVLASYDATMWSEEHDSLLREFLTDAAVNKIVLFVDEAVRPAQFHVQTSLPTTSQKIKELMYFIRDTSGDDSQLTEANFEAKVQYGSVSKNTMESLLRLMQGVFVPMFLDNKRWPDSVRKEFNNQLHKFMAFLTDTTFQIKGHTVLYVPNEDLSNPEAVVKVKDVVQRLESLLIHWTRQIKEVVNNQHTSETTENSGPLEEIQFWSSRCDDLSGISDQLNRSDVQRIIRVLDMAKSSYLEQFLRLSNLIQEGTVQAQDNLKFLSTLSDPCRVLAEAEPKHIPAILPKLLNCIRLIWANSKYYNTKERLTSLLRKVSNEIIRRCCAKISLDDIFHGDVQASMASLQDSINCGESWKQIYKRTCAHIVRYAKGVWDFDQSSIFAQIDAFVQRCRDLLEVCEGQIQFSRKLSGGEKAPIPFFGGSRGPEIAKSLEDIELAFEKLISSLWNIRKHILDVKATRWHDDYNNFKQGVKDLEVMMQNVIISAFEGASTVEAGVELLDVFHHLAKREAIKRTVEKKTADVYQILLQELNTVKIEFETHRKTPDIMRSQPDFAGSAYWARALLRRIQSSMSCLANAYYLPHTILAEEAKAQYDPLVASLEEYNSKTHIEWATNIGSNLIERLDGMLMAHRPGEMLEMKFDKELLRLFAEISYFQKLKADIPFHVQEIYSKKEELRILRENVLLVVRDYNSIMETLTSEEHWLFKERIRFLDRKINPGVTSLTWASKGITDFFVKECRRHSHDVQKMVTEFLESDRRIQQNCAAIAQTLLWQIENKRIYDLETFETTQQRHQALVRDKLSGAYDDIKRTLEQTYEVFRNDGKEVYGHWVRYIQSIDAKLEDALRSAVRRSLLEISKAINGEGKNRDGGGEVHPLFKVNVVLEMQKVDFNPTLHRLEETVNKVARDMISTIMVIPRLAQTLSPESTTAATAGKMYDIIANEEDILKIFANIQTGMSNNATKCQAYLRNWDSYREIWEINKDAFIRRYAKLKPALSTFDADINRYNEVANNTQKEETLTNVNFVRLDCSPLKHALVAHCSAWQNKLTTLLNANAATELNNLHDMFSKKAEKLRAPPKDLEQLSESLSLLTQLQGDLSSIESQFGPIHEMYEILEKYEVQIKEDEKAKLETLPAIWAAFQQTMTDSERYLHEAKAKFKADLLSSVDDFVKQTANMREDLAVRGPFLASFGVEKALKAISDGRAMLSAAANQERVLKKGLGVFKIEQASSKDMEMMAVDLDLLTQVWQATQEWNAAYDGWRLRPFLSLDATEIEESVQKFVRRLAKMGKEMKDWDVFTSLKERVNQTKRTIPLLLDLRNPAMRDRHWNQIMDEVGKTFSPQGADFTLDKILDLGLDQHTETISTLSTAASKELSIEQGLETIKEAWLTLELDIVAYKEEKGYYKIRSTDSLFEQLEDNQVTLSSMKASKFFLAFEAQVDHWERTLSHIVEVVELLLLVQRQWMYLENIFVGTEDIRKQLPKESAVFDSVNASWAKILAQILSDRNALRATHIPGMMETLTDMNLQLEKIQKSLDMYLETKRQAFPRFYFLSNDDLLEILGQAKDPNSVQPHLKKCFDNINKLELAMAGTDGRRHNEALGMHSGEGEYVPFSTPVAVEGPVELWLLDIEAMMRVTLRKQLSGCLANLKKAKRDKWLKDWPGMLLITSGLITWTADCTKSLQEVEKGEKSALKGLKKKQISSLKKLADLVRSPLGKVDRKKLIALITIEVHSRDVIDRMVKSNCSGVNAFDWLSQLRFYWEKEAKDDEDCYIRQINTHFRYGFEFLSNNRLVITPLTDRCYMTLTTALHLFRGGSPQGPAGTGKTETVKDLGKALGKYVIVQNCSEALDYKSIGRMFSGLAQTGAWGCFDEFNRIDIEVLSVVALQISCILTAISRNARVFVFEGREIKLNTACGIFITMNPGYAGRVELPDNLKSLFRPVSMMVPDSALIAEIMLFAEGFSNTRILSKKVDTLYKLAIQQLSKQDHYDFGLRALTSALRSAGGRKRMDSTVPDDVVLYLSMRDNNIPKLTAEDVPLFMAILSDLFPGVEVTSLDYAELKGAMLDEMKANNIQAVDGMVTKIIQLHETKTSRHGVMIVGETGSGKTTVWKVLQGTFARLSKTAADRFVPAKTYAVNPKALSLAELYGEFNINTNEWADGVLSSVMRTACADERKDQKWIVLDGPVDTLWIESMNCFPATDHEVLTAEGFMTLAEVQRHFKQHDTLEIACYVDGRLEYHAITKDKLTIKTGRHTLVDFKGRAAVHKDSRLGSRTVCNNVDLSPTANHRMYAMVAPTRQSTSGQRKWRTDVDSPPAYRILRADEVVAAGEQDESTVAQLRTNAELGFMPAQDDLLSLPFMDALGLKTAEQAYAFLELYGYWLGNGHLGSSQRGVCFAVAKPRDCAYLEGLLAAVGLQKLKDAPLADRDMTECDGYFKSAARSSGQCSFTITARCWWSYFARQYGHKYKGYWCEVAALEGALMRGSGVPLGRYRPVVPAESVEQQLSDLLLRGPPHLAKDAENKPPESSQQRPPAKRVASEPSADAPCKARRVDVLATIARLHDTSMSEPSPPAAEDVKSVDWFWYWVHRHLSGDALRAIVRGLKCADGSHAAGCNANDNRRQESDDCIGTSSARFRDELTRVLLLAGFSTHFELQSQSGDNQDGIKQCAVPIAASALHWKVWFSDKPQDAQPQLHVRDECTTRTWSGTVWCVTVPTKQNLIVFRRVQETAPDGTVLAASRPVVVGNTVLDDNKVLTLINGERIALPEQVSLLFEVENLSTASPATVSRCGMIYMDYKDLGWKPFVESWIVTRDDKQSIDIIRRLIDKYIAQTLEFRRTCAELVPVPEASAIRSFCRLFDSVATLENGVNPDEPDTHGRMVELWFLFSVIWALGGSLTEESRHKFDSFLREIEGQFPSKDTIFEYYVDKQTKGWTPWEDKLPSGWRYAPNVPFYKIFVPTIDTVRNEFILRSLISKRNPVLLVGDVGTGKTSLVQNVIFSQDIGFNILVINTSAQTSSGGVQNIIEGKLEKRTKNVFVPVGGKHLLAFIDDFNMPMKDTFGSQPPLEFIRHWMDYGFCYDRQKQTLKYLNDILMVAAMGPPGGGRNPISPRIQARFNVLNMTFPNEQSITRVFGTIINQKLQDFEEDVKPLGDIITHATIEIYHTVVAQLLPTPAKMHYLFNLRDISKVFQGLLRANREYYDSRETVTKLWVHELLRVFHDRLVDKPDREFFKKLIDDKLGSHFSSSLQQLCGEKRLPLFGDFMSPNTDNLLYEEIADTDKLKRFMEEKLMDYNMEPGFVQIDLVLFFDAIEHICRITRILRQPCGNVLLIGVGGSGRQSLTRLASYVVGCNVFQIKISKHYRHTDFREDLKKLYRQTGIDSKPTTFLFTDQQIINNSFLEDLSNILSSGEVPNLFAADELSDIKQSLQAATKTNEIGDALWNLFIERVRSNLHVVLGMSPVGEAFRNRLRMFPSLINCTTIDWFSEWPEDALLEVALKYLGDVDLGSDQIKRGVSQVFVSVHTSVVDTSIKMIAELKRYNYVTPINYLELVTGYRELLREKRKEIGDAAFKLKNGLSKLDDTRQNVEQISVELEVAKKQVAQYQKQCEDYLVVIVQQKREADEQAKSVTAKAEKLGVEEEEVRAVAEAAQADLDLAMPALNSAVKALEAINKKDLNEIRSYGKPPPLVEKVMEAVMVLKKCEPTWDEAKRQLGNPYFIKQLVNFDKDNISDKILKRISQYCSDENFQPDIVGRVSGASKSLCMWVRAMETYGIIFRQVAPKKEKLRAAQETLEKKQKTLKEAKSKLQEIQDKLVELKNQYDDKVSLKEKLRQDSEQTELKLSRAEKLVSGLSGERDRWENSIRKYEEAMRYLPGDCLLAAAFLSYAGPFNSVYRQSLVNGIWLAQIKALEIPFNPEFSFDAFIGKAVEIRDWNLQGLPSDAFSAENGIIVTRGRRWPLMIDPQGQANNWIKNMEQKRDLKIIDLKQPDFLRTLESAVQFGVPVLLQGILETIDPALDPILNKSIIKKGGMLIIMLGEKEVEYNPEFRFYITTKLANPKYSPEVFAKATIVNFAVKEKGLEDQLLGIIVRREKPELEEQKNTLVSSVAAAKKKLIELEDEILHLLSTAQGSLLDDEKLVNTLQSSKSIAEEVTQQLVVSEQTEKRIDAAREAYRPAAQRASILYFVLNDLASVDPMYQFSLDAYVELFEKSIAKSKRYEDINERILSLNDYHTYSVYKNTCRGLFEKHKMLFAFQMTVKIMEANGKLNKEEYDFLLRGGQVLDKDAQPPNPCSEWITDDAWDNLTELDGLATLAGVVSSIEQSEREWKAWFMSSEPDELALPGDWENKLNDLQKMLVVRSLRPDRVIFCASTFVANNLGQKFIEPPILDISDILADSSPKTPLIFVLSPGVDPTSSLFQLAQKKNMGDRFNHLSLGQGQAPKATRMIQDGLREGNWVFLANCHLSISWMPTLDKIIETIPGENPHPDFRLWLSSSPHPNFPISILQVGLKMTTEPPKGLRANLTRLLSTVITDEAFHRCTKTDVYRPLIFSLCFFHSILLERKKFQSLGWNVVCDFNDSDFDICENLMVVLLDEYDAIPWDALKYLIAEANYGGRVTDDWDRRILRSYINQFLNEEALTTPQYHLSSMAQYFIPENKDLVSFREYVTTLPSVDKPEVFGQHANADIASQIRESGNILETLLSLQPQISVVGGASREDKVLAVAADILKRVPDDIDYEATYQMVRHDMNPFNVVLLQELKRYNDLLQKIRRSLEDLQKGLKGIVVMSPELEETFGSIFEGKVPPLWSRTYASLKPLAAWTRDLVLRIEHFAEWAKGNEPRQFWLGAFTFPTGFLTAVLQKAARKNSVPVDILAWEYTPMQEDEPVNQGAKDGVYIRGLYLEGASWDKKNNCLKEPRSMELITPLPPIQFRPIEARKKPNKGVYICPLYYFPVRSGTRERPSFIIAMELKAGVHDHEFWVKRGTAALASLA